MSFPIAMLSGLVPGELARTANRGNAGRDIARPAEEAGQRTAATEEQGDPVGSAIRDQSGALATKQAFLTLLVAQIKNQNPLNPTDGTEFLSQLAQFSELEQLISIREELESIGGRGSTTEAASST